MPGAGRQNQQPINTAAMDKTKDNYSERFDLYEYETDDDWMDAAIDYGIIDREKREDLLKYIHRVNKRGEFYKPTDIRITDSEIYIPRTMQSLHGYINQWDHERALVKANQAKTAKPNFSREEIPEQMKGEPKSQHKQQPQGPPPSLNFKITEERLEKLIKELNKYAVIDQKTINKDSMRYAITGKETNTPFEAITVTKQTKGIIYQNLLELQQEEDPDSKVLTNERKKNAGNLFKYDDGKPIGPLSNPK
ncbi:MAG: hypothetical protein EOM03_09120 [Clostridia bacterium]|nr:hypothetical protein [Clostridia bacterium]